MGTAFSSLFSAYEAPILAQIRTYAEAETPKVAIVESDPKSPGKSVNYKELYSNVKAVSEQISKLLAGRAKGSPRHVTYLVNPSIAYVVIELAVWAAGGVCVPLSVHSPGPELEYFCEQCQSALCIADAAMESKLKPVAEKFGIAFTSITEEATNFRLTTVPSEAKADEEVVTKAESPALILYTSGTTGKPKGVVHTLGSLTAQYTALSQAWKWSSKDHTLHVLPCHHIHGVQNILNTGMYNGATIEFCTFDAGHCLKRITSGDITCFHAVPTIYVKFTQYLEKCPAAERETICKGLRNESLRYMVSGSAALPVPTMTSWAEISGHVLLERYGMTEIGMALSNNIDGTRYPGCVGWPLPNVEVSMDKEGGVLIKGPAVFAEYYRNPEATKKEFTEDGWFKTGDCVSVGGSPEDMQALQNDAITVEKATGRPNPATTSTPLPALANIYRIMGRSSVDIIKSGGYKLSALEIESVLLTHPNIKECAVLGKPDETWGEKVTAVVVLDGSLTIKELRDWGKERMASYKVPQELEVLTELPRNQMGKLEKKKLMDRWKK